MRNGGIADFIRCDAGIPARKISIFSMKTQLRSDIQ